MLSDVGSYASGLLELCFRMLGAMLSDHGSNALDLTEQCSGPYGAYLYIPIEQCSSTYGAMLWRVRSSAITSDKLLVSSFLFQVSSDIYVDSDTFELHISITHYTTR